MRWGHLTGRLDALALGDLSPADTRAAHVHLRRCEDCRHAFDERVLVLRAARGSLRSEDAFAGARLEATLLDAVGAPGSAAPAFGRWVLVSAGVALVVAVLVGGLRYSARDVGQVVSASGALLIDGQPAKPGARIAVGAKLEATRGDSAVTIDGVRGVLLRQGASMTVKSEHAVALESGRARFSVKPGSGDFVVLAGPTEVNVVGTIFVVDRGWGATKAQTLVAVHRGEVHVRAPQGTVTLTQGREAVAEGETLVVRDASPGALAEDRPSFFGQLVRLLQQLVQTLDQAISGKR